MAMIERFFRSIASDDGPNGCQVIRIILDGQPVTVSVPAGEPVDLDAICLAVQQQRQSRQPAVSPADERYAGLHPVSPPPDIA